MSLFLIRHASAGARSKFDDGDLHRPLDLHGRAQAGAIADSLRDRPIARLLSSEAERCIETLQPLSAASGVAVECQPALTEGARPTDALELIRDLSADAEDVVICSHGDLIPEILTTLAHEGTVLVGGRGCGKGSVWELTQRGRDYVSARYHPADSLSSDLAST